LKTLLVTFFLSLVVASSAAAANWPDSRLDAAATAAAGKPVAVWCEDSWADWIHVGDDQSVDFSDVLGFAVPSVTNTIYIGPTQCENLHLLLDAGTAQVGPALASRAVHTLVHESLHVGLNSGDESLVDCTALKQDDDIAVQFFGFHKTDTVTSTKVVPVTKTVAVKQMRKGKLAVVGHKTVVTGYKTVTTTTQVPSQLLAAFHADDLAWHKSTPPEYQTDC